MIGGHHHFRKCFGPIAVRFGDDVRAELLLCAMSSSTSLNVRVLRDANNRHGCPGAWPATWSVRTVVYCKRIGESVLPCRFDQSAPVNEWPV